MNEPRGLMMVGTFLGTEQVKYGATNEKAGQPVPGFYRAAISIGVAWDGEPMSRQLSYNATDQDTGLPTAIAEAFANCEVGSLVAVSVRSKAPRRQGGYVEHEPVRITRLRDDGIVFAGQLVDAALVD